MSDVPATGCPSGLAPTESSEGTRIADPSPFVRDRKGRHELELAVTGAKCAGCISKIERGLMALPGMQEARLNLSTGKLLAAWTGSLAPRRITETLDGLGYRAVPYDPQASERQKDEHGRFLLRCLAVAGFAAANIMLLSVSVWAATQGEMGKGTRELMHLVSALIAIPAAAYAGRPFFQSAWAALKQRQANMDVPISLAVFLALGVSLAEALQGGEHAYFDAAVMLLFFLLIGRWLDHYLRDRARSAARDLLALQATTATRLDAQGHTETIVPKDIRPGDMLSIAVGDRVPVDVEIVEGQSDIDLSLLTGEPVPVVAKAGDPISGGAVNVSAPLVVRATADVQNSLVADLVRLVEAGQQAKSRFTILADKAARAYVPIVHSLAALTLIGWLLVGAGPREAILAATAVLIITCPCALGLATPAVQVVATGELFRRGILVKSGNALERLAAARHFVFDKTGTLTLGKLVWTNRDDIAEDIRRPLATVARGSRHPISRAIVAAEGAGPVASQVEEHPGLGVKGLVDGVPVVLGRAEFVGAEADQPVTDSSLAWAKIGEAAPFPLHFTDVLREESAATVTRLKEEGYTVSLLSGDRPEAVGAVARELGIEDWTAGVTPQEKAARIAALNAETPVAMIGDGINDAGAMAHATVSMSPGSAADAAQSAADFVFQKGGLEAVTTALDMAYRARGHILQNFGFAALYNLIAAPLAMLGFVTPLIAALAMSGSSLIVTLNALRLAGFRRGKTPTS